MHGLHARMLHVPWNNMPYAGHELYSAQTWVQLLYSILGPGCDTNARGCKQQSQCMEAHFIIDCKHIPGNTKLWKLYCACMPESTRTFVQQSQHTSWKAAKA